MKFVNILFLSVSIIIKTVAIKAQNVTLCGYVDVNISSKVYFE